MLPIGVFRSSAAAAGLRLSASMRAADEPRALMAGQLDDAEPGVQQKRLAAGRRERQHFAYVRYPARRARRHA
jgi:hypothetical protein